MTDRGLSGRFPPMHAVSCLVRYPAGVAVTLCRFFPFNRCMAVELTHCNVKVVCEERTVTHRLAKKTPNHTRA